MVAELILWLGWAVPSAILLALDRAAWALVPPAAFALGWVWWKAALPSSAVLIGTGTVALSLLVWRWRRERSRRREGALERLHAAEMGWWRAMRAHTSSRAGFCARLRAYGLAVGECAEALAALERSGVQAALSGPPPPPELRPEAGRPGPSWLWEQFDQCHRAASQRASLNPICDCVVLARVALELADRIERDDPAIPAHSGGMPGEERAGPQAAMVHVLCAPSLAAPTAAHVLANGPDGARVDVGALVEAIDRSGTDAQRTLIALALLLAERGEERVSVVDLLGLEDTDLAHALEATALLRGLRRVYPSQRPDSLWLRAALTEGGR